MARQSDFGTETLELRKSREGTKDHFTSEGGVEVKLLNDIVLVVSASSETKLHSLTTLFFPLL